MLVLLLAALLTSDIGPAPLRAHMTFLADDLLEGRGTGTRGYDIAARYVVANFTAGGVEPGADGEWLQQVPLRRSEVDRAGSRVEVIRGVERAVLVPDRDYVLSGDSVEIEAPVVFVGYGITLPAKQYDDYAGINAKGKIVAYYAGAPASFTAEEQQASGEAKVANAAAHGAVGMLRLIAAGDDKPGDWATIVRSIGHSPAYTIVGSPAVGSPASKEPALATGIWFSREATETLLAGRTTPGELPLKILIRKRSRVEDLRSPNVIGRVTGSDPKLREEYVVVSAHLDHLGIGEPVDGDAIYNGAIDNASGVAALLELARAFAASPQKTRRSLLFVAFTAEEPGSLGSEYFVAHPPVPKATIVANLNIDGGSVWPFQALIGRGADQSTLGEMLEAAATEAGTKVVADPFPGQFSGSDQYSFHQGGIPAMLITSQRTPEARPLALAWVRTRYHAPSDDMAQPMDFDAAATFVRQAHLVITAIANRDDRPKWK